MTTGYAQHTRHGGLFPGRALGSTREAVAINRSDLPEHVAAITGNVGNALTQLRRADIEAYNRVTENRPFNLATIDHVASTRMHDLRAEANFAAPGALRSIDRAEAAIEAARREADRVQRRTGISFNNGPNEVGGFREVVDYARFQIRHHNDPFHRTPGCPPYSPVCYPGQRAPWNPGYGPAEPFFPGGRGQGRYNTETAMLFPASPLERTFSVYRDTQKSPDAGSNEARANVAAQYALAAYIRQPVVADGRNSDQLGKMIETLGNAIPTDVAHPNRPGAWNYHNLAQFLENRVRSGEISDPRQQRAIMENVAGLRQLIS